MPPRAYELRRRGRAGLMGNWPLAVIVTLVAVLLGGYLAGGEINPQHPIAAIQRPGGSGFPGLLYPAYDAAGAAEVSLPLLAGLVWLRGHYQLARMLALLIFIFGSAVELGHCLFYIRLHRGGQPRFADLFARFHIFLKALGLRLFTLLFILLWMLLLIIPGIVAAYRYSMAFWLLAENPELGVCQAVNMSKYMMSGHKARLFWTDLSFIGWLLLGGLTMGLGYLFINPYKVSTHAAFYLDLLQYRSPYAGCGQHNPAPYAPQPARESAYPNPEERL